MGISIGLVGLGSFMRSFAGLFTSHPHVDRIAFCDLEPDRVAAYANNPKFQQKFSPSDAYDSFEDICKSDLDALVIMTQPWLHAPQAIMAMESGKHVYSAVPIISLPDSQEILDWCDRLIKTCKRTGLSYMLGETTIFRPETMYCKRQNAKGAFGKFVHAEGYYLHDMESPNSNLFEVARRRHEGKAGQAWLKKLEEYRGRGIFSGPMHYPTHSVSGPMSVMNAYAKKVSCFGYRSDDPRINDPYINETALFTMSNGTTMVIKEFREVGHVGSESFALYGSKGSYVEGTWRDKETKISLDVQKMRDPLPEDVYSAFERFAERKDVYGGHGGSHAYLVHEFVDAIAHDRQPLINAWEAVRYMAAGAVAHQSALRNGLLMDVPDWGEAPRQ